MVHLGVLFYIGEGVLLLLGVLFYAKRIPESLKRFKPGTFDIWGSSHQIFHVLVVLAVVCHLVGLVRVLEYNQTRRFCEAGSGLTNLD